MERSFCRKAEAKRYEPCPDAALLPHRRRQLPKQNGRAPAVFPHIFSTPLHILGGSRVCKGGERMYLFETIGDVDDLIYQDVWFASEK